MTDTTTRTLLRDADIDALSERIGHFLTEQGLERQEALRLRLTMRELLLRVRDARGWGTECALTLGRRFGRAWVRVSYRGEAFDPTAIHREDDGEAWSARLLANLGVVPSWSWRRGVNRLVLQPPERGKSFAALGIAAALALALGWLGGLMPGGWRVMMDAALLTPLFDAYFGVMSAFAGVAVFLSAACVMCGAGDTLALGRTGKLVTGRFLALSLFWALLCCALGVLLFTPDFSAERGGGQLSGLLHGLLPADPVSPFLDGDVLRILFLGSAVGAALLALGGRTEHIRAGLGQCELLFHTILGRLCRLMPVIVFLALLRQIWAGSAGALLRLWKPLAAFAAFGLLIVAAKLAATCLRLRVSMPVKKLLPPFLSALSSSSSAAAFGGTMDACETKLGVEHKHVLLGLPVGNVLCVPVYAAGLLTAALYLTGEYGVSVGAGRLLAATLLSVFLPMALPPAPGAYLACAGLLLGQLGLPAESLAAMVVLNALTDAGATALTNAYLQMELVTQADILGALNRDVLKKA